MPTIIAYYLFALSIFFIGMMLWQYWRGTHDLISLRNVLLFGYIIFMLSGGAQDILLGADRPQVMLSRPVPVTLLYAAMATALPVVFLWSYHRGFFATTLAAKVPTTRVVPSITALWIIAFTLLAAAAIMRFGIIPLPRPIAANLSATFPAVACGIAAWIWAPRLFNPAVVAMVAVIAVAAFLIVTTGTFGRRSLVAIGAAVLWGMYYSHFRYQSPRAVLPKVALIGIIPLIAVALFSSVRAAGEKDRTGFEHVRAIQEGGDILYGLQRMSAGQDAAANSMWLIEQYQVAPDGRFETRPLFTAYYFLVLPIPRALWDGKPDAMSQRLPHMIAVSRVDRANIKLSVGIIGHAASEGGWLALIVYGLLGGLLFRFFEEILQNNLWSPFIVLAIGSTLGQVMGIPRGETSVMAMLFVIGIVGTYLSLLILGKMLEAVYGSSAVEEPFHEGVDEEAATAEYHDDYREWDEPSQGMATFDTHYRRTDA